MIKKNKNPISKFAITVNNLKSILINGNTTTTKSAVLMSKNKKKIKKKTISLSKLDD